MRINGTDAAEFIDTARKRWHVPGLAIGVRVGDEERYFCSGTSCVEVDSMVEEGTVFPIGSITKSFVAHAISLAVRAGILAWDVPVSTYVRDLEFRDPVIQRRATLADFLSMRTGLMDEESSPGKRMGVPRRRCDDSGIRNTDRDSEQSSSESIDSPVDEPPPRRVSRAFLHPLGTAFRDLREADQTGMKRER
jgi:CubicO group peptidase (beta-lactamase class C family)